MGLKFLPDNRKLSDYWSVFDCRLNMQFYTLLNFRQPVKSVAFFIGENVFAELQLKITKTEEFLNGQIL